MKTILARLGDYACVAVFLALAAGGVQRTFDADAPLPFSHQFQKR